MKQYGAVYEDILDKLEYGMNHPESEEQMLYSISAILINHGIIDPRFIDTGGV